MNFVIQYIPNRIIDMKISTYMNPLHDETINSHD